MRHCQWDAVEPKGMYVLVIDLHRRGHRHTTDMGQQCTDLKLARQFLEVAVKHRDLRGPVAIGCVRFVARRIPRSHAEAGEVEH